MVLSIYARRLGPGDTLFDLFQSIREKMPPADAVAHLWKLYRGLHFRFVVRLPDLAPFAVDSAGDLVVRTGDGNRRVNPAKALVRKPRALEADPWDLAEMAAFDAAEAHDEALRRAAEDVMFDEREPAAPAKASKTDSAHRTKKAKDADRIPKLQAQIEARIRSSEPWSQRGLAKELGVSARTIGHYLKPSEDDK
jgi:hypothetical protein